MNSRRRALIAGLSLALLPACAHTRARHSGPDTGLRPADEPCAGPQEKIRLRVVDSPELRPDDPLAFRREPMIAFVVQLAVTDVVSGHFSATRLGLLVHSPTMFASDVWGFGASPQTDPAELELEWAAKYCMFELVEIEGPKPSTHRTGAPFRLTVPTVHSAVLRE